MCPMFSRPSVCTFNKPGGLCSLAVWFYYVLINLLLEKNENLHLHLSTLNIITKLKGTRCFTSGNLQPSEVFFIFFIRIRKLYSLWRKLLTFCEEHAGQYVFFSTERKIMMPLLISGQTLCYCTRLRSLWSGSILLHVTLMPCQGVNVS